MSLQKTVAKNVRNLRLERKLRQEDIARMTDLQRSYLSHLETGEVNITIETIERIAAALGVNPLVLLIEDAIKHNSK